MQVTAILDFLLSSVAAFFSNLVEDTVLGAAQAIIDALLGILPTLS